MNHLSNDVINSWLGNGSMMAGGLRFLESYRYSLILGKSSNRHGSTFWGYVNYFH